MKTEQVNLRLEEDLLADLERVAAEEALDRGTVIRRLLQDSIRRWRVDQAVRGYQRGDLSIGRAAEEAHLTHWELLELLRRERVPHPMTATDVRDHLRDADETAVQDAGRDGFRSDMEWLGSRVVTLADVPPREGNVLLIGINPAPVSVAAGHYYQGQIGKRLWRRLRSLGLLAEPVTPGAEDQAFVRAGHGMTDLVKRPTVGAAEIDDSEIRKGVDRLRENVRSWRPGLILFAFKRAASTALGSPDVAPGRNPQFEGVPTFLLTGPYASSALSQRVDAQLRATLSSPLRSGGEGSQTVFPSEPPESEERGRILGKANHRFGAAAVDRYMRSKLQSDAARALNVEGRRLREITRSHGTFVSRGGTWDEKAKLLTLNDLVRKPASRGAARRETSHTGERRRRAADERISG